jgi:hypothetical protein
MLDAPFTWMDEFASLGAGSGLGSRRRTWFLLSILEEVSYDKQDVNLVNSCNPMIKTE